MAETVKARHQSIELLDRNHARQRRRLQSGGRTCEQFQLQEPIPAVVNGTSSGRDALQGQVRVLGGTPEDDGSDLAASHRMFLNLRDSVTKNDESVIDEVERGEDFIKAKYEEALEDDELTASVRDAVVRAYSSIKSGHDQARNLKQSFKGR